MLALSFTGWLGCLPPTLLLLLSVVCPNHTTAVALSRRIPTSADIWGTIPISAPSQPAKPLYWAQRSRSSRPRYHCDFPSLYYSSTPGDYGHLCPPPIHDDLDLIEQTRSPLQQSDESSRWRLIIPAESHDLPRSVSD